MGQAGIALNGFKLLLRSHFPVFFNAQATFFIKGLHSGNVIPGQNLRLQDQLLGKFAFAGGGAAHHQGHHGLPPCS